MTPSEFDTFQRLQAICAEAGQILSMNPTNTSALRRLGYAQWVLSDYHGVEETATRLLAVDPTDVDWIYSRAMARLALRRPHEAEADLICARAVTKDVRMTAVLAEAMETVARIKEDLLHEEQASDGTPVPSQAQPG